MFLRKNRPVTGHLLSVIVCVVCLSLAGCQKVELPTDEDADYNLEHVGNKPDDDGVFDDGGAGEAAVTWNAMTVKQVQQQYAGATTSDQFDCKVLGYIVGYAVSNTIKNTRFTTEGAVESNIVIADRRDETDPENCMAVQLEAGKVLRTELNLKGNPGNLGRRLCLYASASRYYNAVGLRNPEEFVWVDDTGDGDNEPDLPDVPDTPDTPDNPDTPDIPDAPDTPDVPDEPDQPEHPVEEPKTDTLKVDDRPAVIPGGRVRRI